MNFASGKVDMNVRQKWSDLLTDIYSFMYDGEKEY